MSEQHQELQVRAMAWIAAQCYGDYSCRTSPELFIDDGYILDVGGIILLPSGYAHKIGVPLSFFDITPEDREVLFKKRVAEFHLRYPDGFQNITAEYWAREMSRSVVAWGQQKVTVAIEVKRSKSDFLNHFGNNYEKKGRDKLYAHLQFVFAPMKVLSPADLPLDWGLVEVMKRGCRVSKMPRFNETPLLTTNEWANVILWKEGSNYTFWERFVHSQGHLAQKMLAEYREESPAS